MNTNGTLPLLTPEILVPRLGDYLVEKKLITIQELNNALEKQHSLDTKQNPPKMLGQILMDMQLIDRPTLDQAVTEQIIQLREALERYNQELELRVGARTAELQDALSKLSELSLLKANFISNISHELRTPLTHIKGYLDLFLSGVLGKPGEEQAKVLEIMDKATQRLESLIEDLILFSVTEHNQLSLQYQPFNLPELFQSLESKVKDKAEAGEIIFSFSCPSDIPSVNADREKISWVINHLIENAIKFTPPAGSVTLSAKWDANLISIIVKDTGIGIANDKFDKIFEPFHQLDGSSKRKFGGTGLGLALVKKIIDAHNSVIRVSSQEGKGSQFEFLLNAYKGKQNA